MYILLGLLTIAAGILFLMYWIQIKGDKERYYQETDSYPIYHWRFLFYRYKVWYVLAMAFVLLTLGPSIIIVFI